MTHSHQPAVALLIVLIVMACSAGCDVLYRSRIDVSVLPSSVAEFSVTAVTPAEVDSVVRDFGLQNGYEIENIDTSDRWVQQETKGEEISSAWVGKKAYEAYILFTASPTSSTIRFIQLSGPLRPEKHRMYTSHLYEILGAKFGTANVRLME